MPPTHPQSLKCFLGRITRNLALNRLEKREAQKRGGGQAALSLEELGEVVADGNTVEAQVDEKALLRLLNRFVGGLPKEKQHNNWYGFWVISSMMANPAPDELETIYTPAALPEKFHLAYSRPGGKIDDHGNFLVQTSMERRWETWEGHAVTLRQKTFSVYPSRAPSSGTWERVWIGDYVGYRSKWDQNDVLVWATNEYLYILQLEGESAAALDAVTLAENLVPEGT
jgi:hypothetical protein